MSLAIEKLKHARDSLSPELLRRKIHALDLRREELWLRYNRICNMKRSLERDLDRANTDEGQAQRRVIETYIEDMEDTA